MITAHSLIAHKIVRSHSMSTKRFICGFKTERFRIFSLADIMYMFLVGGFAESSIVQHEMRKDFGPILKIIIPPGVGMSILRGKSSIDNIVLLLYVVTRNHSDTYFI